MRNDPAWPFRQIAAHFSSAAIAFANLESPFAANGPYFEERMVFRAHPSMIAGLTAAGFDVLSTANNHARDAGPAGIAYTIEVLEKAGIAAAGTTGKAAIIERGGVRFGFLAYTFDQRNGNTLTDDARVAMMDLATAASDIAALRRQCDVAIVSMHAGWEYHNRPNAHQTRFARAAIDAGAALVIGHHPHAVQPVEPYRSGLIFYSLGNLVFDQTDRPGQRQGAVADVYFEGPRRVRWELRDLRIRGGVPALGAILASSPTP